jgi:hypothetical protein
MEDGKLPINEDKKIQPVELEGKNEAEAGFSSPRDDSKGFLGAYFDGPYERPFRKREHASADAPDGTTLGELVDRIRR